MKRQSQDIVTRPGAMSDTKTSKARLEHPFVGTHVLAELYGVDGDLLGNPVKLAALLELGINQSGATLCGLQTQQFEPQGVTVLALLAESHASIHSYPERGALFFDAFTCGEHCQPERILAVLVSHLNPSSKYVDVIVRGGKVGSVTE